MCVLINVGHMEDSEKFCLKMSAALDVAGLQVSKVTHQGCSSFHLYHFKSSNIHDVSINVSYLIGLEKYIWLSFLLTHLEVQIYMMFQTMSVPESNNNTWKRHLS